MIPECLPKSLCVSTGSGLLLLEDDFLGAGALAEDCFFRVGLAEQIEG